MKNKYHLPHRSATLAMECLPTHNADTLLPIAQPFVNMEINIYLCRIENKEIVEIRFEKVYLQELYKTGKTKDKNHRLEFREIDNPNNLFKVEICSIVDITKHYK